MSSQPLPDLQREFLETRRLEYLQAYPEYTKLEQRLLSMGGEMVVPRHEPDQDKMLSRGKLWVKDSIKIVTIRGTHGNCHGNVAEIWRHNPERYHIATGWALSEDGLWRQHSWIIDGRTVIETTTYREKYFGFVLTPLEAQQFEAT
ncbi:unnamed protein product [marine sediment metagenome]|uniref:Uncharacterized protein n=1 Tax=marine sediment metagenome TaxID=412755 RepID=X1A3L7_9ZZZZ